MKKHASAAKVVIKTLGKSSGNVSSVALSQVVRDARGKYTVKKGSSLEIGDTATGSGHISFLKGKATVTPKRKRAA